MSRLEDFTFLNINSKNSLLYIGCCVADTYVGCIMYADDILLMSASVVVLQSMLDLSLIHI